MDKIKTIEEIAQRILALKALLWRSDCEGYIHMSKDQAKIQGSVMAANETSSWISREGIQDYLSPLEKEALVKPVGAWDQSTFLNSTWRMESLAVILWSAGIVDNIPPYDIQANNEDILVLIRPFVNLSAVKDVIKMRQEEEIIKQRDIAELWHWRSRTTKLIKEKLIPANFDENKLMEICKITSQKSFELGEIPKPINNDFPAFNKAYKDLADEEYHNCTSIAMERHFGLNWVCGYGNGWDDTPTGT